MRKAAVAFVLAIGLTLVGAPDAGADTPGCVTRAEFNSVRQGATRQRVTSVFDIPGRVVAQSGAGGYAFEIREYRPCAGRPYSYVSVDFDKEPGGIFRLAGKTAYWG